MTVDIQNFFDEVLPGRLASHPAEVKALLGDCRFQFLVTGEGGGEWLINTDSMKVERGNPGGSDITISIAEEDFQNLYQNPKANGLMLFFQGKLKVMGNQMLAMKMGQLFTIGKE